MRIIHFLIYMIFKLVLMLHVVPLEEMQHSPIANTVATFIILAF
jgi:hypothetical protein